MRSCLRALRTLTFHTSLFIAIALAVTWPGTARAQIIIGSGGGGSGGGGGGVVQGSGTAGTPAGGVLTVQGSPSGTPIPVTGTFSAAAAAPTIGPTKTMTGNNSCATVWLAGQTGASFFFSSGGSLATTLTPVVYDDATQSGSGCTGGTAVPVSFVDPLTVATTSTLVVTNVNVGALLNLRTGTALCAAVCTAGSGTTGTATGFLVASSQVLPAASGSSGGAVNITQINGTTVLTGAGTAGAGAMRVAVATSDGAVLATANTGRLQVDVVTGGGSNASVGAIGSPIPLSATLGGMGVGGTLVGLQGSTNGLLVDAGTVVANQGIAALGSNAWPTAMVDTTNTVVKPGDASNNAVRVNVVAGAGSGGTASTYGAAFPTTGTAVGAKDSTGALMAPLNLDASGFLKVNVAAGGGSGGTSSSFGAALPTTGTATGYSDGTNMQAPRAKDTDTGGGTHYTAEVILQKSASGGPVDFGTSSDPIRTDPTGTTIQPVSGTVALGAGAATIGALTANQSVNLTQVAGSTTATGHGTAAGAIRVELPTDGTGVVGVTGTVTTQGLGTAGSPAGGVTSMQGVSGGQPVTVGNTSAAPLFANAADNSAVAATMTTTCASTTACLSTASIQWSVQGSASAAVTITAISSPVGAVVNCDLGFDTGGTTYSLNKCTFTNSNTGVQRASALGNADLVAGQIWRISWDGSPSTVRVRSAVLTGGNYTISGRSTLAPNLPAFVSAAVAGGMPQNATGNFLGLPVHLRSTTSLPTAVANSDPTQAQSDHLGRMVTVANADRALITEGALVTLTATTTETTLVAAGGAGVFLDMTSWHCDNSSATAVTVSFRDATAGTVRDTFAVPAGGSNGAEKVTPWKQATANNNWTVQSSASVTSLLCRASVVQVQ